MSHSWNSYIDLCSMALLGTGGHHRARDCFLACCVCSEYVLLANSPLKGPSCLLTCYRDRAGGRDCWLSSGCPAALPACLFLAGWEHCTHEGGDVCHYKDRWLALKTPECHPYPASGAVRSALYLLRDCVVTIKLPSHRRRMF